MRIGAPVTLSFPFWGFAPLNRQRAKRACSPANRDSRSSELGTTAPRVELPEARPVDTGPADEKHAGENKLDVA